MKMYYNGTIARHGNQSGSGSTKSESPEWRLTYGGIYTHGYANQGYAVVDSVMIWEKVLTDGEVSALYQAQI